MENEGLSSLPIENLWKVFPDTYAQVCSNGTWTPYRHLVFVMRKLAEGLARGNRNFIVNMPAAYGKTMSLGWLVKWYMDLFPNRKVVMTGYNDILVDSISRDIRDDIRTNPKITAKIIGGSNKINDFKVSNGSSYWGQPAKGTLTGRHFHLGIIDDPIKNWDDALSENFRNNWKTWYHSVFYKRRLPGACMILNMTRWHEDDPAGYLIEKEEDMWEVISLPKLAEPGDLMGRAKGEALCPELYPQKMVEEEKRRTPQLIWDAMDQQHPSSMTGNVIKRQWWQYWTDSDIPKRFDEIIATADLNFFKDKKLKNDRTAYVVLGLRGPNIYVLHAFRDILDFDEQVPEFSNLVKRYPAIGAKLVEDKANGHALESTLKHTIPGIMLVPPEGGKLARVLGVLFFWKARNIFVPKNDIKYAWVKDFINEHSNFPQGRYDDQVDAMSLGLVYFQKRVQGSLGLYTSENMKKALMRMQGSQL